MLPLFKGVMVFPDLERQFQLPSSVRPCLGLTKNASVFLRQRKKSKAPKLFKHLLVSFRGRERLLCETPEEWVWVEDLDLTIKSCSWLSTVWLSLWASVSLLIPWRGWTIAFFGVCSSPIVYDLMYYSPLFFPCIPFSFSMCIPSLKEGDNILLLWRGPGTTGMYY